MSSIADVAYPTVYRFSLIQGGIEQEDQYKHSKEYVEDPDPDTEERPLEELEVQQFVSLEEWDVLFKYAAKLESDGEKLRAIKDAILSPEE